MKSDLKNHVVMLTGAGGGIGRAIATKLAKLGMRLVLLGGGNLEKLETTGAAVEEYAPCVVLPGDLTDLEFLSSGVKQAVEAFGGVDVLINNAGTAQSTPFEKIGVAEFDRIMAINFRVPFFLTHTIFETLVLRDGREHLFGGRPCRLSVAGRLYGIQARAARVDQNPCPRVL